MNIVYANYGGLNVVNILKDNYNKNGFIKINVSNDVFTDPDIGVYKFLDIKIDDNGTIFEDRFPEGTLFTYPEQKYKTENTLILTSCNRIEAVLLGIAVNSRIIKHDFNLIIVDSSTPHLSATDAVNMHVSDDPYNLISKDNYNPHWHMLEDYIKTIPNIKEYRIIHESPRLNKQVGEATLMSLGLVSAGLLGSKYAIKLTGVCHLKYDIFGKLEEYCGEYTISTFKRTFFDVPSTRVLLCNPSEFGSYVSNWGWYYWIREYGIDIEHKLELLINRYIPKDKHNYLPFDESNILVDEGDGKLDIRGAIMKNLTIHNLLACDDVWIQKFINGGIC